MIHPEGLEVRAVCLDASRQNARVEETNVTRNGKEMTCTLSTDPDVLLGFMVRVQDHFRFHSVKSISSRLNMQLPGRPHNAAQPQAAIAFPDNKQELHQGFQLTGILGKGCEHWVRVDDDGNPKIKTHTYNAANGIMTEGTKNLDHVLVIVKGCRLPVVRGSGSLTHQQYRTNYLHDDCNRPKVLRPNNSYLDMEVSNAVSSMSKTQVCWKFKFLFGGQGVPHRTYGTQVAAVLSSARANIGVQSTAEDGVAEDGAAEGHGSVEKTVQTPAGTRGTPTDPLGEEILNMPGVVRVRPRKRRAEIIQTVDTRSKRTRTRASRGEAEDGDDAVSEISQGITARLYIHDRGVGRRSEATYLEHSNSCLEQIVANNARLVELQRKKDAEAEAKQKKD